MPQVFRRPGITPLTEEELQRWANASAAFATRRMATAYSRGVSPQYRDRDPETLEQVIHRLHRRQQFYLTHTEELPSW